MKSLLNRTATPLTIGLFAVSAVSGTALFFHVGRSLFHSMHEWLSLVLLVPVTLHVWRNWGALLGYVRRGSLILPLGVTAAAALLFVLPGMMGQGGGEPPMRAAQLMTQLRLTDLAPILKTSPEALEASLRQQGYKVMSTSDTIDVVASGSGASPVRVLLQILPAT